MKDGFKLHPQPTSDPLDPLNWSSGRKHGILAIVMALYFMFTYITTTTVPSFPQIQEQFNITVDQLNWTVAIPALGLAVGPLIWSSLADIYGRRIIFIIGTITALAATIGVAATGDYGGYMAGRFFQGLGVSPAATVGLAIINDIFFEYQRGQKVGLWVLAIDMGLFVGPLFGGFLSIVDQYWINWFTAILFGVILLAEIFFLPETLYPRNAMLARMPYTDGVVHAAGSAVDVEKTARKPSVADEVDLPRTKKLFFVNWKPVPGMKHPKPWDSALRFGILFKYPAVSVSVFLFCYAWYWWVLSVVTMIPVAYIQYTPQIQGLLFIGLILGTLFSEVFFSGQMSDFIVKKLAKKNAGIKTAEMRLWLIYPAALLSAIGLIIWGISIDKNYHWIVGQIAFFLFAAGIQMGNTSLATYIVDCYPLQSMSIVTFYSVLLNLSAFINPFFIAPWQAGAGWTWTFAAQGIITFFVAVPGFALIQKFGAKLRGVGTPSWVNPEFDGSS
ncbi:MFS transporter [Aulographum hederae CBS 113979]|uniref:MFS transporter n=1 Tax=Aulographum hederae CBS 113979 TaxID=1176131 RepID=A0A6G1HEE3_9PEZI|nr:MFS transporter [Aulographum hederae CBS 113979]